MSEKLFSAPRGNIRVALLNGQATTITSTPKPLPECFWADAYAKGAVTGDMVDTSIADKIAKEVKAKEDLVLKQTKELKECLQGIFKESGGFLGKDNKPIARRVSAKLGRAVNKPEVLDLWDEIVEAS